MVLVGSKKLKGISFEEITALIDEDREFREAMIRLLARDHAEDYLKQVNLNVGALSELSARVVSSAKEWQD